MDRLTQFWQQPEISSQLVVLAGVAGAMLLGGLIGYERKAANKPAGFRTQMMLTLAPCLIGRAGRSDARAIFKIAPGSYQRRSILACRRRRHRPRIHRRRHHFPLARRAGRRITGRTAVVPLHFATAFWVGAN